MWTVPIGQENKFRFEETDRPPDVLFVIINMKMWALILFICTVAFFVTSHYTKTH